MKDLDKSSLIDIRKYSESSFDKQLVYLAGGGLVLTIGFIKEVIDLDTAKSFAFLFLTWICFTLSLTINLFSHKSSTKSVDLYIKENYGDGEKWNKYTRWLNHISILFLTSAIVLFIIFVFLNISK
jgi:hypothetical protein